MYNLLSDKLDRFEREVRKVRNQLFGKTTSYFLKSGFWVLKKSRAYIHTERLKQFRELLTVMLGECELELDLRRKIQSAASIDQILRDSSVLNNESLQ